MTLQEIAIYCGISRETRHFLKALSISNYWPLMERLYHQLRNSGTVSYELYENQMED